MKLYNHTVIPDNILEPIIKLAAKSLRPCVRHGKVIIRVNRSQVQTGGNARPASWVAMSMLARTHYTKASNYCDLRLGRVKTDGGWITVRIPKASVMATERTLNHPLNALEIAERFFWICVHEYGHIRDYQSKEYTPFGQYNRNWKNRPHERRAEAYMENAKERDLSAEAEDAILNLAIYLEEEAHLCLTSSR